MDDATRRRNASRLGRATQQTERGYQNPVLPGRVTSPWVYPGIKIAKVGGTKIDAMSGSTPESGDVTIYDFDNEAGTLTARSDTDTAWNNMGEIAANAWIKVGWVDGAWWVINEYCP